MWSYSESHGEDDQCKHDFWGTKTQCLPNTSSTSSSFKFQSFSNSLIVTEHDLEFFFLFFLSQTSLWLPTQFPWHPTQNTFHVLTWLLSFGNCQFILCLIPICLGYSTIPEKMNSLLLHVLSPRIFPYKIGWLDISFDSDKLFNTS